MNGTTALRGFVECTRCGTLFAGDGDSLLVFACPCTALLPIPVPEQSPVLRECKPRRKSRNYWREMVTEALLLATLTWERERDEVCIGYGWEETEWALEHPRPTLKYMMKQLAGQMTEVAA